VAKSCIGGNFDCSFLAACLITLRQSVQNPCPSTNPKWKRETGYQPNRWTRTYSPKKWCE